MLERRHFVSLHNTMVITFAYRHTYTHKSYTHTLNNINGEKCVENFSSLQICVVRDGAHALPPIKRTIYLPKMNDVIR